MNAREAGVVGFGALIGQTGADGKREFSEVLQESQREVHMKKLLLYSCNSELLGQMPRSSAGTAEEAVRRAGSKTV